MGKKPVEQNMLDLQLATFINKKNPPIQLERADSFFRRFLGLMGRKKLLKGHGLLLAPCNSIHMFFMRFPIDAIYIDKNYRVLKIVRNLLPWTGFSWCPKAWAVIEVNAGDAKYFEMKGQEGVLECKRDFSKEAQ